MLPPLDIIIVCYLFRWLHDYSSFNLSLPDLIHSGLSVTYGTCQSKVRVGAGEGELFDTTSGERPGNTCRLFIM